MLKKFIFWILLKFYSILCWAKDHPTATYVIPCGCEVKLCGCGKIMEYTEKCAERIKKEKKSLQPNLTVVDFNNGTDKKKDK